MPENLTSDPRQAQVDRKELEQSLQRLKEGDTEALSAIYRLTSAAVFGFALSILKKQADAEDVLQETYLALYKGIGGYVPKEKPMAWVLTITKNLARMKLRNDLKVTQLEPEAMEGRLRGSEDTTVEDRMVLETLLTCLSDEERQVVLLHAVAGLKHREIALLLALPLPTVLSKYRRALKKCNLRLTEGK